MTAKELDIMVNAMKVKNNDIKKRTDILDAIYYLYRGVNAIGRNDIVEKLIELYTEVDGISTDEIVKLGIFN